ncbi:hypothetical protein DRF59_14730 [Chryseobacterium flavum]|uniref:Uncharacterized protein n=2 Tax=Chryseobacterium flavum TaxID=415851 RepID=A0A3D9CIY7_9FLAO|nr:hypothetical protein DRF59_14730 [Chryseobacterium flavum]
MDNKLKNKMKKILLLLALSVFICVFVFTSFFGNLYSIVTENGYEIPKESSVFTFEATKMNSGSGGWWMYGEDHKKYYALTNDSISTIISINKTKSKKIKTFDKLDYKTWKQK